MIKKGLTYTTFIFSLLGVILLITRALGNNDPGGALIATSFYYTTQSNLLVFIVVTLYVFGNRKTRLFQILAFIAAVDITVTGIVFHLFLTSYVPDMNFMQHLLHTIVPVLYLTFYILITNTKLTFSKVYIVLIHPLLFLSSVYLITSTYFKDLLRRIYYGLERPEYIYPFLDPNNYDHGLRGVLLLGLLVFTPSYLLLGSLYIYLKRVLSKA